MAALTVADELLRPRKNWRRSSKRLELAREETAQVRLRQEKWADQAAAALDDAAAQVEAATRALNDERG